MESVVLQNKMLERNSISDYLPYIAYNRQKDCYILENGVGIIYECSPLQFPSTDHRDTLQTLFESQLLPGTSVQFLMYASRNVEPHLDAFVLSRKRATGDSTYTAAAEARKELYIKGAHSTIIRGNMVKVRSFRLFVSMTIPCAKTPQGYERCLSDHLEKYREGLRQVLTSLNMNPQPVSPDKFNSLLTELINPDHPAKEGSYDPTIPIRNQVVFSDTEINVHYDHLKIDKSYTQSMTVKQYPEEWNMVKCMNFVGSIYENSKQIGVPFVMAMNCEYPDQVKDGAKVQKKAMAAKYQAFGELSKWVPQMALKKANFDILQQQTEDESLLFGYFNIFFYAKTQKEMYDTNQAIHALYRSMGIILQDDPFIAMPLFLQMLPMGYNPAVQNGIKRRQTRTTGTIAELLPIYTDWSGDGRPVIQLISRRGQVQHLDIFSNTKGGYSSVVVAQTGSGKSFFVNEMTMSYLGHGAKIWTIDIGRSYEKLCDIAGGQFITFSADSKICLNPFTLVKDLSDEMPMLKSIVAQMASREPLDDLSMAFIEEAIKEVFGDYGPEMNISMLADYLSTKDDHRQKELAMRLYPYSKNGAYNRLFNGACTLDEQGDYIVYELEELRSKKDLQEVVLLSLVFQIQQDMLKRDREKILFIDESWELLTGGNTTSFIQGAYRRFRKFLGSCITITQSINDFYNIPAGVAIMENSDYFFLLRQRPESIEALKKSQRLSLSDGAYDLLRSVTTETNSYSEVLAYTPYGIMLGRLVVDRFTQLAYTSRADEVNRIKAYREQGYSTKDAINIILEEEKRNAA